jgi:hypothetical protein
MTINTSAALDAADVLDERYQPCALDIVREFIGRFIYADHEDLDALTLWIAHTYVFRAFYATPRLFATSDREDCGKSTVLNVSKALSLNGVKTANASVPSIFAIIEQEAPTLFFDETDNMFGSTGNTNRRRDLMGILNDGYTAEGYVLRSVDRAAHRYPVFVVAAFAGIGRLPKTMESRCVIMHMRPKPNTVKLEKWRPDMYGKEAEKVADSLASWVKKRGPELNLRPKVPEQLGENRASEIWEVLIAIGDLAGPEWGVRAREAALKNALGITSVQKQSPSEEFIEVVAANTMPDDFLPSGELIDMLAKVRGTEEKLSWAKWLEDPIVAARQISSLMRPYGIESEQKWLDGENRRGYSMGQFHMWADRIASSDNGAASSGPSESS